MTSGEENGVDEDTAGAPAVHLRLYLARATPNSVRAERSLATVLEQWDSGDRRPTLDIVDVFSQPKRAITEGVVVTPTLIGVAGGKRIVLLGDLSDQVQLTNMLKDLVAGPG